MRGRGHPADLEGSQLPLPLEGGVVYGRVVAPQLGEGLDPSGVHGLRVGEGLGGVAVFGGVIVADEKVGHVNGEVFRVDAAEVNRLELDVFLSGG